MRASTHPQLRSVGRSLTQVSSRVGATVKGYPMAERRRFVVGRTELMEVETDSPADLLALAT
jgi:hypothetical protein